MTPFRFPSLILALVLADSIQATPIWFSFQGVITSSVFAEMPVGSAVEYILMVDRELPGKYVHHGQAYPILDEDFFYVENAGLAPAGLGNPYSDKSYFGFEKHEGAETFVELSGANPFFYEHPESGDGTASIRISMGKSMDAWEVGDGGFLGSIFPTREFESDLRLTGISGADPAVPEPGTLALLGLGLIVLWQLRRDETAS
jgi:PEP-CTERM motif-containing protein